MIKIMGPARNVAGHRDLTITKLPHRWPVEVRQSLLKVTGNGFLHSLDPKLNLVASNTKVDAVVLRRLVRRKVIEAHAQLMSGRSGSPQTCTRQAHSIATICRTEQSEAGTSRSWHG
jgi:hypothetical protein